VRIRLLLTLLALGLILPAGAHANVFQVGGSADGHDAVPGDGACATTGPAPVCTLRAAVEEAGALAGADEIVLAAGVTLTEGQLEVADPDRLEIRASAPGTRPEIVQDTAGDARVLRVDPTSDVVLRDLALTGGAIAATAAGDGGAGVRNDGRLHLARVQVRDNVLTAGGGCLGCAGGGVFNAEAASLTVVDSEIRDNTAGSLAAGGIYSGGELAIAGSTVAGNQAGSSGGFLVMQANAAFTNVTVTGNSVTGSCGAGTLEAAAAPSTLALEHATVTSNSAFIGPPGLCAAGGQASLRLAGTVLDNEDGSANCATMGGAPAPASAGHNLESGDSCNLTAAGDRRHTAPGLGPFQDNGGPAWTLAPRPGSPLIDSGGACPPPSADARGLTRPQGLACDIGAVEVARSSDVSVTGADSPDPVATGANLLHRFTVANAGPDATAGVIAALSVPAATQLLALPAGCTGANTTVTCPIGALGAGATRTLELELRRAAPGTIQTRASVSANPTDPNAANNGTQVTSTVAAIRAVVRMKRRQRLLRQRGLVLRLTSALDGVATVTASVSISQAARRFAFRSARRALRAGSTKLVRLRAPRRLLRAARRALSRGVRLRARVVVRFAAQAQEARPKRLRVRLLR
jgi:hypothetical protein